MKDFLLGVGLAKRNRMLKCSKPFLSPPPCWKPERVSLMFTVRTLCCKSYHSDCVSPEFNHQTRAHRASAMVRPFWFHSGVWFPYLPAVSTLGAVVCHVTSLLWWSRKAVGCSVCSAFYTLLVVTSDLASQTGNQKSVIKIKVILSAKKISKREVYKYFRDYVNNRNIQNPTIISCM